MLARSFILFFFFLSSSVVHAQYSMSCRDIRGKIGGASLLNANAAANPSKRLISDIYESRSATDQETLPAYLVAQYKADSAGIFLSLDDGSPAGNLIAELDVKAIGKKKGDKALWRYQGTYKRFDAGRQLNVKVECAVTQ